MLQRETITYITGLILIVSAVVLLGLRAITFENAVVLIGIGLGVMGFGTFTPRDAERQLNRILYAFRNLQPIISFEGNRFVVSILEGGKPAKLVKELTKLFGLPVEVKTHKEVALLFDVYGGDGIRPVGKNWEGSLGYVYNGYYYTNAHVLPELGLQVQHTKTGNIIGVCDKVAPVKTISPFQYFLSIFGRKLPTNKVDAARVKPTAEFRYIRLYGHNEEITTVDVGDHLVASGRTTGVRQGKVVSTNATTIVPWPHNGQYAIFTDVIHAKMYAKPGDSGGPVVHVENSNIVGLIFAGAVDGSFALIVKASNIRSVLD